MRSLSRTLEQKCSMHCFSEVFVSEHSRQTSQRQEWLFILEIAVLLVLFAFLLPATTKRVLGSQCSPSHTCSTPQLALGAGTDRVEWLTKVVSLNLDTSTEL